MSMNANTMGVGMRNAMLATCNKTVFGAALKAAVKNVTETLGDSSDPADAEAYQTAFWEAVADQIIGYLINNSTMWVACANQIIAHISQYATIDDLPFETMLATDGSPHTHLPGNTSSQTGKIS